MKKATLIFLIDFYHKGKSYKPKDEIEIDIDQDGKPIDHFWSEQIKFNDNHFELKLPVNKKTK